jgi:hypothetical protein
MEITTSISTIVKPEADVVVREHRRDAWRFGLSLLIGNVLPCGSASTAGHFVRQPSGHVCLLAAEMKKTWRAINSPAKAVGVCSAGIVASFIEGMMKPG